LEAAVHKRVNRSATPRPAPAAVPIRAVPTGTVQAQSTLRVSSPRDPAEKEAEATARKIMRMATPEVAVASAEGSGGPGDGPQRRKLESPYIARFADSIGLMRQHATVPTLARQGEGQPAVSANVAAEIAQSQGAGAPLPTGVRKFMEPRFGADFSKVRIHTGEKSAQLNRQVSAQAFTVGHQIFFGKNKFRPETTEGQELIAHELTHTIQQGAAVQQGTPLQRQEDVTVGEQSSPHVQRLGLGDVLGYFGDAASALPGFRLFTLVLGINPITMNRVDRGPANVLRAIVEFLPGGVLITRALDNHGVFDRVGGWVEQQLGTLGLSGSTIRDALDRFLDSLSLSDVLDLDGVWARARRLFTEPIDRIIRFTRGLFGAVMGFIRDAILRPIAELASGTRGWNLLCAVLGVNPITGEAVPRSAESLIGGFMKLIGQEEIWENIKRGNAIARAWTWFQGALTGVLGFVRQIPQRFVQAVLSLGIEDLLALPRAFARVAGVFGDFIGNFLSWAGNTAWELLEIVFSVVAPSLMVYLRRAAGAFRTILQNPVGFVGYLVRAATLGFRQFSARFLTHLRGSLIGWLTGALSGANIYIPQSLTLREFIKFVLSVLGLTWQNIRQKLVRAIGEPAMSALETSFDIVMTLVTQGPAAAWEQLQESLSNLRELVMEQIMTFVQDRVVTAAVTRLLSMLSPAGAFIQAILATYNTVMFFVERLRQLTQVATSFIDSIATIATGNIASAANRVEQTMGGMLTLVISFLARIAGVGQVTDAVTNVVNRVRQPIDRALDGVVDWIVTQARRLGRLVAGTARPNAGAVAANTGNRDRHVPFAREDHTVRAHIQGNRLRLQMASAMFLPVEEQVRHIRHHFVERYLPAVNREQEANLFGSVLDQIIIRKNELESRYNAAPEAQKTQVLEAGMDYFVASFALVNQALDSLVGPWATVRVGDTVTLNRAGSLFGVVDRIMHEYAPRQFGLYAVPTYENPRGRRVPAGQLASWQENGASSSAGRQFLFYHHYGTNWTRATGNIPLQPGSRENPFLLKDWPKPASNNYPTLYFGGPRPKTPQTVLRQMHLDGDPTILKFEPHTGGTLGGKSFGVKRVGARFPGDTRYHLGPGTIVGPLGGSTVGGQKLIEILRPYGFDPRNDAMQADHVHEMQFGGEDTVDNLWPLATSINQSAGSQLAGAKAQFPNSSNEIPIRDLKRLTTTEFYFKILKVR
jgi:hypothetical protein